ncbi:metal-response element-binding transcription factor 2-like [Centruroides sculpturatus]|uniref:metal-response element-binding transcription factor 2-like n=1 Tax=Centruroides sculpturatus TaxID=218467 RepID=UPI000C6DB851|nr:metal-response element-binding transcription factor 2-like [Centruroides sculpturatus]
MEKCAMSVISLHDSSTSIHALFGCGNEEWRTTTGIRPRAHSRHEFKECCEVLARWSDGLSYLGIVVEVDNENQRCLVNFEDNSLHWILYKDLQTGTMQTDEITCAICDGEKSEAPNEIVICDRCNRGYHQLCHRPSIPDNVLKPEVQWHCRQCIFASTAKKGGARKRGPDGKYCSFLFLFLNC